MDRLTERVQTAQRALATLREALGQPRSPLVRDACIQRFEYTFEATWKAAQLHLRTTEGLETASPKSVVRACHALALLGEEDAVQALEMTDDRNLTVHTYGESLADTIYDRLEDYADLLDRWLASLS